MFAKLIIIGGKNEQLFAPRQKVVLLVENNGYSATASNLKEAGYAVNQVTTGEKAVELVRSGETIDLVICHVTLGQGLDGVAAAKLIIKERDLPLLFLSECTTKEIKESTADIEHGGQVHTSFSSLDLDTSIERSLSSFATRQELITANKRFQTVNKKLKVGEKKRKAVIKELKAQKLQEEVQLKNSPDLYMRLDREYRIVYCNKIIFGVFSSVEEAIGRNALEPVPENMREFIRAKLEDCFTSGKIQEFDHQARSGEWAHDRIVPLFGDDGTVGQVMVISTDITKRKEMEMDLKESKEDVYTVMAVEAEYRDHNTGKHIQRTKLYIQLLINELEGIIDWTPEQKEQIYLSAPLHDIGKVGIPDNILLNKGRLTKEEFEIMKKHTIYGCEIIDSISKRNKSHIDYAKEIIRSHHEKWDGTGYPDGLKGQVIPLSARMMAIADVYDALVSERPYKKAMSHKEAVQIIQEGRETHFDPMLVDVFFKNHLEFKKIAEEHKDDINGIPVFVPPSRRNGIKNIIKKIILFARRILSPTR